MTGRAWLFARCASVVLCAGIAGGAALGAAGTPQFRLIAFDVAALPRVRVLLDARDDSGEALSLKAADFHVVEGNSRAAGRKTLKFREADLPLALVVVIDASPSMAGKPLDAIRQGVAQLVSRKREGDRTAILSFANDLRWDARWDATDAAKQEALRGFQTRGDRTRLYDAIWEAMDEFAEQSRVDGFPSRMSILVMTDGHDEGSGNSLEQVTSRLGLSRIRLDGVGLARSPQWLKNLQQLTIAGFGAFSTTTTPEGLTDLLEQGLDHVLDAPVIEFDDVGFAADGAMHRVSIEYAPTMWQDEAEVSFPGWLSLVRPTTWIAGGAGVFVVVGGIAVFALKRRRVVRPIAAQPVAAAAVAPAAPPPVQRASTMVESPRRAGTAIEPTPVSTRVPSRQSTMLASQSAGEPAVTELVAVAGPYAGQRFPVSTNEFWIGSSPNNHLCLSQDSGVSGNHACIRREERFHRVFDNGSLNGTYVNGRPIGQEPTLVRSGDRIRVGQSDFSLAP